MLEMPEAAPTCSGATDAVEADEAGPLARPRPTATATRGRTNAQYDHPASTKARTPAPTRPGPRARRAESRTPSPPACREPIFWASGVISGVMAIIAAAAGSVA